MPYYRERVQDLLDVDASALADKTLPIYDSASGKFVFTSLARTAGKPADGADTEYAFSMWRTVEGASFSYIGSSVAATTWVVIPGGQYAVAAASSSGAAIYLDPADYGAGTRTVQVRVRAGTLTNAVAPACNFTFGLYPIATWGGTSGNFPTIATLGAATCSVTRTTPSASSQYTDVTTAVTFPTAGWYALVFANSATTAANSDTVFTLRLQARQV